MPNAKQTLGRLADSCEIYATNLGNLDPVGQLTALLGTANLLSSAGSLDVVTNALLAGIISGVNTPVAAVTGITDSQNKTLKPLHGIGANAFEPSQIIPVRLASTLTLKRIDLYDEDIAQAFGFPSGNIMYQETPIVIKRLTYTPQQDGGWDVDGFVLYTDCYMESNGTPSYDLDADMLIRQNVTLRCGKIFSSDAFLTKVSSGGSVTLKSPLSFL